VALDGNVLFFVDTGNVRVRAVNISAAPVTIGPAAAEPITLQPGELQTVMGLGPVDDPGTLPGGDCIREAPASYGQVGRQTPLSCPSGVAVVPVCDQQRVSCVDRFLVVTDTRNHQLLVMSLEDLLVSRFAGRTGQSGYMLGNALEAKFSYPVDIDYSSSFNTFLVSTPGNEMLMAVKLADADGDGIGDSSDNCVDVPNPEQADLDGDEFGDHCDLDVDGDTVEEGDGTNPCTGGNTADCQDNCPTIANPAQEDGDADGVGDACDNCPGIQTQDMTDADGDGRGDACDNCPMVSNQNQFDLDGDGTGDACEDDLDGDGVLDDFWPTTCFGPFPLVDEQTGESVCNDNCPTIQNPDQVDSDYDYIGDACDNCMMPGNEIHADCDGDGQGDLCQGLFDYDGDGIAITNDNCPCVHNVDQGDIDGDGVGDLCDESIDGDSIPSESDNCPLFPNERQEDLDGDGIGDACDPDLDNDGIEQGNGSNPCTGGENQNCQDNCPEKANPDQTDVDGDGVGDVCDGCPQVFNPKPECQIVPGEWNPDDYDCLNAGYNCVIHDQETRSGKCEEQVDTDRDGIPDACDLCPSSYDPENRPAVGQAGLPDPKGAACWDTDGDGITDHEEMTTGRDGYITNPEELDTDGDGIIDSAELDPSQNDGFLTNPTKADTDGDGCNDLEDRGPDNPCAPTRESVIRQGEGTPTDDLPDPPQYWLLELKGMYLEFQAQKDSDPKLVSLSLPKTTRLVIGPMVDNEGNQTDIGFRYLDYFKGEVDFRTTNYKAECPRSVEEDDCTEKCIWKYTEKQLNMPISVVGKKIGEYAYFSIGPSQDSIDVEHYYIVPRPVQECEGIEKNGTAPPLIAHIGEKALMNPLLPSGSFPDGTLEFDHYTFKVPYEQLQRGEKVEGIRLDFVDPRDESSQPPNVEGSIQVSGSIDLVPIYVEVSEPDEAWLPEKDNDIALKVKLRPERLGAHAYEAKVRLTLEERTAYDGYSMNKGFDDERDTKPDLTCLQENNQEWVCPETNEDQENETVDVLLSTDNPVEIELNSYDYASYAKVRPEIIQIGKPLLDELVGIKSRGRVKSRPAEEDYTTVPLDRMPAKRPGMGSRGNKIADWGWQDYLAQKIEDAYPAAEDNDSNPAYGVVGDGLSVIEEYRGFSLEHYDHARLNPEAKDVFYNAEGQYGIGYGENLVGLATHPVAPAHWKLGGHGEKLINHKNIDHSSGTHMAGHRRQCAIFINEVLNVHSGTKLGTSVPSGLGDHGPCGYEEHQVYPTRIDDSWYESCQKYPNRCDDEEMVYVLKHQTCLLVSAHEYGHAFMMAHPHDSGDCWQNGKRSVMVNNSHCDYDDDIIDCFLLVYTVPMDYDEQDMSEFELKYRGHKRSKQ
jgi:hypothetical protein